MSELGFTFPGLSVPLDANFVFIFKGDGRHFTAAKALQQKQQPNHETSINISHLKQNETSHAQHWCVVSERVGV